MSFGKLRKRNMGKVMMILLVLLALVPYIEILFDTKRDKNK